MNNLSRWIDEVNIRRNRMILSIIAAICYTLMYLIMTGVINDFNSVYMFDLKFFYTGEDFYYILVTITQNQINLYQVIHYIDYIFILTFYPLYVLILDKSIVNNKKLIFLPLLAMLFDFMENIIIDIQLHTSPSEFFGSIAGVFTLLKFVLIIAGLVLLLINYYLNRKRKN